MKSTQLKWLLVLSNIASANLRKQVQTELMVLKLSNYLDQPIQKYLASHPSKRIKSRNPIWSLTLSNKTLKVIRASRRTNINIRKHSLVSNPGSRVPGFELNQAQTKPNRLRIEQGKCTYLLHKWGITDSPFREYGVMQTTRHIVEECKRIRFEGDIAPLHKCGPTAVK